jgi:hypothetical protein
MKPRPGPPTSAHCKLTDDQLAALVTEGDPFAAAELQRRHGWATLDDAVDEILGDDATAQSIAAVKVGLRPYLNDEP